MLLQHAWLAPLAKPEVIHEEDEDEEHTPVPSDETTPDDTEKAGAMSPHQHSELELPSDVIDREVAEWVIQAIEKRKQGKLAKHAKPALHAAPLDAVATPEQKHPESAAIPAP